MKTFKEFLNEAKEEAEPSNTDIVAAFAAMQAMSGEAISDYMSGKFVTKFVNKHISNSKLKSDVLGLYKKPYFFDDKLDQYLSTVLKSKGARKSAYMVERGGSEAYYAKDFYDLVNMELGDVDSSMKLDIKKIDDFLQKVEDEA